MITSSDTKFRKLQMRFRTELKFSESDHKILYKSKILCLGSCFAQYIGNKLKERLFDCIINPWGIAYNALSISSQIEDCQHQKNISESELDYNPVTELFSHKNYHSEFSDPDPIKVVTRLNRANLMAFQFIQNLEVVIISLGTSYAYQKEKSVVTNCHKFPISGFNKILLDQKQQVDALSNALKQLQNLNPNLKTIITVSPVRHIKEGLANNQLSKSILRTVSHQLTQENKNVEYFPSYEILIDDLRDYRFYTEDLIHPNAQAIHYIWDKFQTCYFDEVTIETIDKIERWISLNNHKIFYPDTGPAKKLQLKKETLRKELVKLYPYLADKVKENA